MSRFTILVGFGLLLPFFQPLSATEELAKGFAFFENEVRPILVSSCLECHSEEAGKRKGGLWLDRKAGWALGGDGGPALVPGDPDGSLLIRSIRYSDEDLQMPPKTRLAPEQIATLEKWVAMGAPDPRNDEMAWRCSKS
jgi:mono/diheme cytochrome c family protein